MKLETTRREWTRRVEEWRGSGKSARVWCRENNLVYSTFVGWTHRIDKPSKPSKTQSSFIELKDQPPPASGIILECYDVRINLTPDFDLITLNRCLQALRGKKC